MFVKWQLTASVNNRGPTSQSVSSHHHSTLCKVAAILADIDQHPFSNAAAT
jgi:hypothetical protein